MEVRIKKLYKDSILPTKAHASDAGYDLYAHSKSYDNDGNVVYGSGVAMEIPKGYVGLIFPRSSNAKKDLILSCSVGVIDSGFRGEISFKFSHQMLLKNQTWLTFQKAFQNTRLATASVKSSSCHTLRLSLLNVMN